MGVAKFYRWISERYPCINQNIEDDSLLMDFDNLYLDLNGVIHNATHGNEGVTRKKADDVIARECCATIDRIVKKMRPSNLIYMAVDGCAPRAKQNQQRSRRTRAAKDSVEAQRAAEEAGEVLDKADVFDSNCITPGTPFMDMINKAMKQFVVKQLKEDPAWQGREVVFSGSDIPGEGEHKIVAYIRGLQGAGAAAEPNLKHCMVGLDADLVMLSLATHQPHFSLLREHIDFNSFRANKNGTKTTTRKTSDVQWQLLHVGVLREYLEIDMKPSQAALADAAFTYDGERVIDDFVLLTVLCGNDFVPHLPSLDIGEGALDKLMAVYKQRLPAMGGYLTDKGIINFTRVQMILDVVAAEEPEVFAERAKDAAKWAQRAERDASRDAKFRARWSAVPDEEEDAAELARLAVELAGEPTAGSDTSSVGSSVLTSGSGAAAGDDGGGWEGSGAADTGMDEDLKALMPLNPTVPAATAALAASLAAATPESDFKTRYYYSKMGVGPNIPGSEEVKARMVKSFAEALQWVMLYYYQGVPSWGWFYPFHYAPMTSDLVGLDALDIVFELGQPFRPYMQLLATLPANSASHLPKPYQTLMTSPDSPILDFYPHVDDIRLDANGKRNPWEAVTLAPFIDEARLLAAVAEHCPESALTPAEVRRNTPGTLQLLTFDASVTTTIVSETTAFPDAVNSNVRITQPYDEPHLAPGVLFDPKPPVGCIIPAPGYPTLHALPLKAEFKAVKLNVFGFGSRKPSTIVTPMGTVQAGASNTHIPVFSTTYAPGTSVKSATGAALPPAAAALPTDLHINLEDMDLRAAAEALLGRAVYVEYPHLRAAQVVAVSDVTGEAVWYPSGDAGAAAAARRGTAATTAGGTMVLTPFIAEKVTAWKHDQQQVASVLLAGGRGLAQCGLAIGFSRFLVKVRKLVGMSRDTTTGALHRVFAAPVRGLPRGDATLVAGSTRGEVLVPGNLLLRDHPHPDPRWVEAGPQTVQQRFPLGRPVVVLRGPYRGIAAKVSGYGASPDTVLLEAPPGDKEPPFGRILAKQVQDRYFDSKQACSLLKISTTTLGKLSGSVMVKPGMYDLGLNFKVWGGKQYLPGYVKSVGSSAKSASAWSGGAAQSVSVAKGGPRDSSGPWVYTERALQLLAAYKRKWPGVFEAIGSNPKQYSYTPMDMGGIHVVEGACKWLHQLDSYAKPLAELSTVVLSPVAIQKIEQAADAVAGAKAKVRADRPDLADPKPLGEVPVADLYAREDKGYAVGGIGGGEGVGGAGADATAGNTGTPPTLGDRVLNLAFPAAPLGMRGVVVATHPSTGYVEVVFDEAYVGGSSLGGVCSVGRGALVQWNELLCLSSDPAPGAGAAASRGWETSKGPVADPRRAAAKAAAAAGPVPKKQRVKKAQAQGGAAAPASGKSLLTKLRKGAAPAPAPAPAAAAPTGRATKEQLLKVCASVVAILSPVGLAQPINAQVAKMVATGAGWVPLAGLIKHPALTALGVPPQLLTAKILGTTLKVLGKGKVEVHASNTAVRPVGAGAPPAPAPAPAVPAPALPPVAAKTLPQTQGKPGKTVADLLSGLSSSAQARGEPARAAAPGGAHATLHAALSAVDGVDTSGAVDVYAVGPPEPSGPKHDVHARGFKRRRSTKAQASAPVAATGSRLTPSALLAMARGK